MLESRVRSQEIEELTLGHAIQMVMEPAPLEGFLNGLWVGYGVRCPE